MTTLAVNQITTQTGNTITLPTGKKIVATDSGSIVVPGQILQVQTSNSSTQMAFNVGTPTWTDITGMSVNITPNTVGNKIIVFGLWYYGTPSNPNGGMRCYRAETSGGGNLAYIGQTGASDGDFIRANAFWSSDDYLPGNYTVQSISFHLEDTAPSTNQLTYKLQFGSKSVSQQYVRYAQPRCDFGVGY